MTASVWILTTLYRNDERWQEDGTPSFETFIEDVFASQEAAMAYPEGNCSEDPMRWYRPVHHGGRDRGRLYGFHRPSPGEHHLHELNRWDVHDEA